MVLIAQFAEIYEAKSDANKLNEFIIKVPNATLKPEINS